MFAHAACEATCELCGFDFENRKALASHARAHLRQQGEQWSSSQSPIVALSQWMSREPEKVAALHQLYMQGTLPQIRKVHTQGQNIQDTPAVDTKIETVCVCVCHRDVSALHFAPLMLTLLSPV